MEWKIKMRANTLTPSQRKELLRDFNRGWEVKDLSEKYLISDSGVRKIINANGISIREVVREKKSKEFLIRSREVHGTRYDYSSAIYVGAHKKVCIGCKDHGPYWQTPNNHTVGGCGCPRCVRNCDDLAGFVDRANKIHSGRYEYSDVVYRGSQVKVNIICGKHGVFLQTPNSHLQGQGCPLCSGRIKTQKMFISEAKSKHGNKYDYSEARYKSSFESIDIICPDHGPFKQLPSNHLKGHGCQKCAFDAQSPPGGYCLTRVNRGDFKNQNAFLYVAELKHGDEKFYKVGVAKKGLFSRLRNKVCKYTITPKFEIRLPLSACIEIEQHVLASMSQHKYEPSYRFEGWTECLGTTPINLVSRMVANR